MAETPSPYCLVKFRADNVTYICPRDHVQYKRKYYEDTQEKTKKKHKTKIVPFAKYKDSKFYRCKILCQSDDKKALKLAKVNLDSRTRKKLLKPHRPGKHFLVRFLDTRDYFICTEIELHSDLETKHLEDGLRTVHHSNGLIQLAQLIQTGEYDELRQSLISLRKYENMETPEKSTMRHPLLPKTPKVNIMKLSVLDYDRSNDETSQVDNQSNSSERAESNFSDADDPFALSMDEDDSDYYPDSPLPSDYDEALTPFIPSICSDFETNIFSENPFSKHTKTTTKTDIGAQYDTNKTSLTGNQSLEKIESDSFDTEDLFYSCEGDDPNLDSSTFSENEVITTFICGDTELSTVISSAKLDSSTKQKNNTAKKSHRRMEAACLFCRKLFPRVERHIINKHKNEKIVDNILEITDSKKRSQLLRELRIEGTYRHNCAVRETKQGQFIPPRRPKPGEIINPDHYLPCPSCKVDFQITGLAKHVRTCDKTRKRYDRVQSASALLLPNTCLSQQIQSSGFQTLKRLVYPHMKVDEIRNIATTDALILLYGANYCCIKLKRVDTKKHLIGVVSQNMRRLGRLVQVLRQMYNKHCQLRDYIKPSKFDDLCKAVAVVAGLKDDIGEYRSPSVTVAVGHLLKHCATIIKCQAIRTENEILKKHALEFLELYETEWRKITTSAIEQLQEEKFKKKTVRILPFAEDILKFNKYLQEEEKRFCEELREEFNFEIWSQLGRVLLCSLILFNRKRVGDVQRIKIENYNTRSTAQKDDQIYQTLDPVDRLVAAGFVHFYTRGKKDSLVPIMIPVRQIPAFDLYIRYRKQAKIEETNPFLFAKSDGRVIDGCVALRYHSKRSGAQQHHLLRSTLLRKHVATMSQILNLQNGELDILASYMGHSIEVHRNFYRLPDQVLHLAKISKILLAASNNEMDQLRGQSLQELPSTESTVEYLMPLDEVNPNEMLEDYDEMDLPTLNKAEVNNCTFATTTIEENRAKLATPLAQMHLRKRSLTKRYLPVNNIKNINIGTNSVTGEKSVI